jgi:uncharacterized membrane protein (DUF106 family)
MKIVMVFLAYGALVGWIFHLTRQVVYWREKAMTEARKRLAKDEKTSEIRRAIDRGAAKLISEKDAQIRELQEKLRYKTIVNARLWEQLRDLKAGGDFDD